MRANNPGGPPRATLRQIGDDERLLVLDRPVLHIGRARERCGLVFDDPELAPQHCCLRLRGAQWWLLDRGAPAGTYLNNQRCREPTELRDGDRISVGLRLLEFRCAPIRPLTLASPDPLELTLDNPPPPPRAAPFVARRPGLLRTACLTALAACAATLPVAANLTTPVPSDMSDHTSPNTRDTPLDHISPTNRDAPPRDHTSPTTRDASPRDHSSIAHTATHPEFVTEPPALELPPDARTRGRPDAGTLEHALQLPPSPDYTIRCPAHAYASSTTASELMQALASFRNHSGYRGELVVGDLSLPAGGRYGPHRSHQSGRDVDLWLPIVGGRYRRGCVRCGTDLCRPAPHEVDWRATWQLVHALATSGRAQDIFLAWELHPQLRRAARSLGVPEPELAQAIQHPVRGRAALVKHAAGHTHHLHVRFRCPPDDPSCVASP